MVIETLFYLPNHFRQALLVNSNTISFTKSSDALLDLMNMMFKINTQGHTEFKLTHFFAVYRNFFSTTMLYESFSIAGRIKLYRWFQDEL